MNEATNYSIGVEKNYGGRSSNTAKQSLKKDSGKEEKRGRKLTKTWHYLIATVSVFMVCFYFYSAAIKPVEVQYNRGFYVLITYIMVFLLYPFSKRSPRNRPLVFDIILALASGIG